MIELVKVSRLEPLDGYRLRVTFSNQEIGDWDFASMVGEGGAMLAPLVEEAYFARVFVQNGVPAWPNGFAIDAIALHDEMKAANVLTRAASTVV